MTSSLLINPTILWFLAIYSIESAYSFQVNSKETSHNPNNTSPCSTYKINRKGLSIGDRGSDKERGDSVWSVFNGKHVDAQHADLSEGLTIIIVCLYALQKLKWFFFWENVPCQCQVPNRILTFLSPTTNAGCY